MTVQIPSPDLNRELSAHFAGQKTLELANLQRQNVFFSLKVIDRTESIGRSFRVAENIRSIQGGEKTATGRRGILPVEKKDLGDELWRLEIEAKMCALAIGRDAVGGNNFPANQ